MVYGTKKKVSKKLRNSFKKKKKIDFSEIFWCCSEETTQTGLCQLRFRLDNLFDG